MSNMNVIKKSNWYFGEIDFLAFVEGNRLSLSNLYPRAPFYKHGYTLIPAWISNHMPSKVWDEITYPFLNFNGCTVEV